MFPDATWIRATDGENADPHAFAVRAPSTRVAKPGQLSRARSRRPGNADPVNSTVVRVEHAGNPASARTSRHIRAGQSALQHQCPVGRRAGGAGRRAYRPRSPATHRDAYANSIDRLADGEHRRPQLRFLYKMDCRAAAGSATRRLSLGAEEWRLRERARTIVLFTHVLTIKVSSHSPASRSPNRAAGGAQLLAPRSRSTSARSASSSPTCSPRRIRSAPGHRGIILNRWGHAYVNPQPGSSSINGQPAPRTS